MDVADIKNHIKTGNFDKFYIFFGEEHQIMKEYIKRIASKKYKISYVSSIYDVLSGAKVKSLIYQPNLYIIVDDKDFQTEEKLWEKFTGLKDDIVIFYYTSADQRLKFWKKFKDRAVEFTKLDEDMLTKYIQNQVNMDNLICKRLISVCENDYGRILLELDKIKQYCHATKERADAICAKFLIDGTIYRPPKDAIFDFVNAVLDRDTSRAFNLLEQSYKVGEANMVLLLVLYTNIKNLLIYQSSNMGDNTLLSGWEKKNVAPYKGNYSNGELVKAMKLIRKVEKGIKTGEISDEISMYYVLVKVM